MNQMIELLREGAFFCFIAPTLIAIGLLVFVAILCDEIRKLKSELKNSYLTSEAFEHEVQHKNEAQKADFETIRRLQMIIISYEEGRKQLKLEIRALQDDLDMFFGEKKC